MTNVLRTPTFALPGPGLAVRLGVIGSLSSNSCLRRRSFSSVGQKRRRMHGMRNITAAEINVRMSAKAARGINSNLLH